MRKVSMVILCMVCTAAGISSAQPRESVMYDRGSTRLLRLYYENSSGEKGVSVFNYTPDGQLAKGLWYLKNGKRNSVNFYSFDDSGRLCEKFRIFSGGKTSTVRYEYNRSGLLQKELFERSDGVTGNITYYYDEMGRQSTAVYDNGQGWFTGILDFQYDEDGRAIKADISRDSVSIGMVTYTYSGRGCLEKEHWEFKGKWSQTFRYEYDDYSGRGAYAYDLSNPLVRAAPGMKTGEEAYTYNDKLNGFSYLEYAGKMLTRKIYYINDQEVRTVTHYLYDGKNRLINSLRRYADGNTAVFEYTHNAEGRIIQKTALFPDGKRISEIYTYDKKGMLCTAVLKNFDSWLSGTIHFTCDKSGRIMKGLFTGRIKDSGADIRFRYDAGGNTSLVQWDFDSGDFQRYTFGFIPDNQPVSREKPSLRWFNQPFPGDTAVLFAPGIVCNGLDNRDVAVMPGGKEIYFCVASENYRFSSILRSRLLDDIWTKPQVLPFAADPAYLYAEPCITSDGRKMFFLSNMPADTSTVRGTEDIWCVDRTGDTWSEPYNLGMPVNTEAAEYFPSVTRDGTLYFTRREQGQRQSFIYRSTWKDRMYSEPEKLPVQVNCGAGRFNAFVASDESFVIVPSFIKENTVGGYDYYIVFRSSSDTWSEPVNMGPAVNSKTGSEWSPYVTPDGRYFFFMASRELPSESVPGRLSYDFFLKNHNRPENGNYDIYWMSASFIDDMRASAVFKTEHEKARTEH